MGWFSLPEHFCAHCDAPCHANEEWPSIDALSLDAFIGKVIIFFEHLTHLDQLPQAGFLFTAFPLKIKGGSGSPVRATGLIFE